MHTSKDGLLEIMNLSHTTTDFDLLHEEKFIMVGKLTSSCECIIYQSETIYCIIKHADVELNNWL